MKLRDLSQLGQWLHRAIQGLQNLRVGIALMLGIALALLLWQHDKVWNRELSALSPVSAADQKLNAELSGDMGAPEMRYLLTLNAPDIEHALQATEKLEPALQKLVAQGVMTGFNTPASVLPSQVTQTKRRAALPDTAHLQASLNDALHGMPIKAERLQGFIDDVAKARQAAPLNRESLNNTSSALLVDSLLVQRAKDVLVLLPLRAPAAREIEASKVEQALADPSLPRTTFIDLRLESFSLYATYLREAAQLAGFGCLAIGILLWVFLRSGIRALRICAPLACSVLCVAAGLVICGTSLTILHLVGLLLVVAVGSNYALFFDQSTLQSDDAARRQTVVSLCVANLTTVSSFGVLACSKVPVLADLGLTVGPGAFLALVFSAALAPAPRQAGAEH